jgi:hypothetical protein
MSSRAWASAMTWPTAPCGSASAAGPPRRKSTTPRKIVSAVRKLRELSPLYDMHKEGIDISKIEWQAH